MTPDELRRLYFIIRVLLSYGVDEFLPKMRLTLLLRFSRWLLFWIPNQHQDKPRGECLRLALQQLGPVWVKFGQMMSTRRDLLPKNIADQLTLLQDRVAPFNGDLARKSIEQAMGGALEEWFDDFNPKALASASIAQVHSARIKTTGQKVVLKVVRPEIRPIIKSDIRLLYRLASWLPVLIPDGRRLRSREIVKEYEKTLLNELNLLHEAANATQLRRNFENSPMLYVPKVYTDYCRESVLVMERIYGIPISDINALEQQGTNMKLLAERGVQVFFTQVFRDSFFHADMHPGNIFVSHKNPENPCYIGIDYGIVGSLKKADKRYLAENFIAFFNRDYRKVAELHVDAGWVPNDTSVEDFEFAIYMVCEPIFKKPLAEISFGKILFSLFNTARRFNMEVQPQLFLLQKTLLYVEGLSKELYPQLDLWITAKPFLESWLRDQVGIPAVMRALKEKSYLWIERMPELPELLCSNLQQNKFLQQSLNKLTEQMILNQVCQMRSRYLFGVGALLLVSGSTLLEQDAVLPIWMIATGIVIFVIGWYITY